MVSRGHSTFLKWCPGEDLDNSYKILNYIPIFGLKFVVTHNVTQVLFGMFRSSHQNMNRLVAEQVMSLRTDIGIEIPALMSWRKEFL